MGHQLPSDAHDRNKDKRLTWLFLCLVQDANDSGRSWSEPVKNHKRILADDKLPVRSGFQFMAYLRVLGYLQDGLTDFSPDFSGGGCSCCFDVILGDTLQVAVGRC